MDEEPKQTYTAREIVQELFPGTHERLVPGSNEYWLERIANGNLVIFNRRSEAVLTLSPVASAGNTSTQVACDLCQWSAPRHYLQTVRISVPGSDGRRFRYASVCRSVEACERRRLDDTPLRMLIAKLKPVS